jgi:parallel beta-helix repeat protein
VASDWRTDILTDWKIPPTFGGIESSADGLKLTTRQQPEHIYSLQTRLLNKIALKKGDTILIQFAGRSLKTDKTSGVTRLRASFGKGSPPWDSSHQAEITLSPEWRRFDMPFRCKNDFAPGEAQMTFTFGFPAQEAEIGDVRVLRYGAEVAPEFLPKSKRYADPVSPEKLAREVDRIVDLRKSLAVADPSPAKGKQIHVQTRCSASGDGSLAKPFATIPQALAVTQPGDTILVGAGEYREPQGVSVKKSGRADAWIKIKAAPGSRPKIVTSGWSGFEFRGGVSYVEVEGFELEWKPDVALQAKSPGPIHGSGVAMMYASHHIRVLNNVVHGYGTGGIVSLDCDYLHIEGNTVYDTAKTSPYGGSAISLCRAFNSDDKPGYHNVIRRNVCYDNELRVSVQESSGGNGKVLTDGNGIIVDVFNRSRANPLKPHGEDKNGPLEPYRGRTLVENNLIYNNGGRGIHIFRSNKVDVINNTCYQNQKTPTSTAGS